VVGCYVDIIRQDALDPFCLCAFLRSRFGRAQMDRIKSGVGTVNMNFDEIRGLRIVLLPAPCNAKISQAMQRADHFHQQAVAARGESRLCESEKHYAVATRAIERAIGMTEQAVQGDVSCTIE